MVWKVGRNLVWKLKLRSSLKGIKRKRRRDENYLWDESCPESFNLGSSWLWVLRAQWTGSKHNCCIRWSSSGWGVQAFLPHDSHITRSLWFPEFFIKFLRFLIINFKTQFLLLVHAAVSLGETSGGDFLINSWYKSDPVQLITLTNWSPSLLPQYELHSVFFSWEAMNAWWDEWFPGK